MEIDELPSGTQDQKPDIDMNEIVGTHDYTDALFRYFAL